MEYYAYSNAGSRTVNEDSFCIERNKEDICFIIADGLGGHGGGDIASKAAVDVIASLFRNNGFTKGFFKTACSKAQKEILDKQSFNNTTTQMKTTVAILVFSKKHFHCAHIGDSRVYYFKDKSFSFHTLDHSVPQMLAQLGDIKPNEIRNHPDRSRLMRVLGDNKIGVEPDFQKPIKQGGKQAFLLCTDGYWELIDEANMVELLHKASSPKQWIEEMNKVIEENGRDKYMDNLTAIAIFSEKKTLFGR